MFGCDSKQSKLLDGGAYKRWSPVRRGEPSWGGWKWSFLFERQENVMRSKGWLAVWAPLCVQRGSKVRTFSRPPFCRLDWANNQFTQFIQPTSLFSAYFQSMFLWGDVYSLSAWLSASRLRGVQRRDTSAGGAQIFFEDRWGLRCKWVDLRWEFWGGFWRHAWQTWVIFGKPIWFVPKMFWSWKMPGESHVDMAPWSQNTLIPGRLQVDLQ